ncbi:iron-containing redox enzyme family protein [Streptomyces sp. HC44]|uniref:Iron-containing redox enzyme family protein n=1 Tax=Streptomyces scabichelini TaxID=2711217 RepID=A0A6G4VDL6_9ACTN|nr:iron-containing redox enzyme family protein [Streptomyces scabichelini]NGO11894.1 iron-containing redox enzyme family protein [Streptomyces scabichelini]
MLRRQPPGEALPLDAVRDADPYGEDLQLALYACYELHYRGFSGVDPGWEWDPELLRLRAAMEFAFHEALREEVAGGDSRDDLERELDALLDEPRDPQGVARYLKQDGTWEQLREYFVHRSAYQLKEADPQAWVIPRLEGRAKAALVAVEYDEFGGGRAERVHARLFADLMADAGLDPSYGHYVDAIPAVTLATVNLMSYLGLHRARRAALVGHFAAAEITTAPAARSMVDAIDRLGAGPDCRFFYSEHVEADAVHEQVLRRDVIGGLLAAEPALRGDVVFGIQATGLLDARVEHHLLDCWRDGRTSLRKSRL